MVFAARKSERTKYKQSFTKYYTWK